MNLTELKTKVDRAIEYAKECGESTDEIVVSIQIDLMSGKNSMCVDTDIEVHYDNNLNTSGCVITAVVFDKKPCNTQMHMDEKPCKYCNDPDELGPLKSCTECGRVFNQ